MTHSESAPAFAAGITDADLEGKSPPPLDVPAIEPVAQAVEVLPPIPEPTPALVPLPESANGEITLDQIIQENSKATIPSQEKYVPKPADHHYHYRPGKSDKEIAERTLLFHIALVKVDGDRGKAAELLSTSKPQVTREIQKRPFLHARWAKKKNDLEPSKLKKSMETKLAKILDEREREISNQVQWMTVKNAIYEMIINIYTRLQKPEKLYRDEKGRLVEEKMLRDHLTELMEQYRRHSDSYVEQFSTMAKVNAMREGASPEANGSTRGKPGFRPKGDSYTMIKTDSVNIQQPAAK